MHNLVFNIVHMKKSNLIISLIAISAFLSACSKPDVALSETESFIQQQKINKQKEDWKTNLPKPDVVSFDSTKQYIWQLDTNLGKLEIELFYQDAPMHVSSTIYLTKLGFYDNLTFHRVIPGFMAQGGDPIGNGRGNPGYRYDGEFSGNLSHDSNGMLSMANAGPGTDGSQFFITFTPTPFLDGKHTIFGKVISGLESTLSEMEKLGSRRGKPTSEIKIVKATILVKEKVDN